MLLIHCRRCGKDLDRPGGLLFSAPDQDDNVTKTHLCVDCLERVWLVVTELERRIDEAWDEYHTEIGILPESSKD